MKRMGGGAEIWADGYSYLELRHCGLGLVPYHHETRPSSCSVKPLEPLPSVQVAPSPVRNEAPGTQFTA